jgi:hypothetical protein
MPQQLISEANALDYANEIAMGAVLLMVAIADGPYLLRRIRMARRRLTRARQIG